MAPGVLRIPLPCFPLIIPIRITLCIPLFFATLDGYAIPPTSIATPIQPKVGQADPYMSLRSPYPGHTLILIFAALSIATSLVSVLIACGSDPVDNEGSEDGMVEKGSGCPGPKLRNVTDGGEGDTETETRRKESPRLVLALGVLTRVLLATLGGVALAFVPQERAHIKSKSFFVILGLGWAVVAVLGIGMAYRVTLLVLHSRAACKDQDAEGSVRERDGGKPAATDSAREGRRALECQREVERVL